MLLKINGAEHQVDTDDNMPLLCVLRDLLKMTGTKFGCGKGLYGACTLHFADHLKASITTDGSH